MAGSVADAEHHGSQCEDKTPQPGSSFEHSPQLGTQPAFWKSETDCTNAAVCWLEMLVTYRSQPHASFTEATHWSYIPTVQPVAWPRALSMAPVNATQSAGAAASACVPEGTSQS